MQNVVLEVGDKGGKTTSYILCDTNCLQHITLICKLVIEIQL